MRYNDKYRVVCCDPRTGARWLVLTVFTAHMVSACAVPHSDWDWLSSTHSATCRALTWPGPLIPSPAQSEISALTDKLTTTISNILPPLRWPARASSCFYDQSVRQAASDYFSYSSLPAPVSCEAAINYHLYIILSPLSLVIPHNTNEISGAE